MAEISKICFSNPKKANSIVRCHHLFPATLQRKLLGEGVFLIQVKIPVNLDKSALSVAEEVLEIIINGLRTNYYTPDHLRDTENIESLFESSLQKVNRLISQEIIGSKIFEKLVKNLNAIIGMVKDEKVYFSTVGNARSFILRKNKIINLESSEEKMHQTPFKTFLQIVSGSLEKDDILVFSTDNFLDYFTFEKLRDNVLKFSGAEAAKNLEKILGNLKDEISLGALLIKKEEVKVPEVAPLERKLEKLAPKIKVTAAKIEIQPVEEKIEEVIIKDKEKVKVVSVAAELKEEKEIPVTPKPQEIQKPPEKAKIRVKLPKISLAFIPSFFKNMVLFIKKISLPKPRFKITPVIIIILIVLLTYTFIHWERNERETLKFFLSLQEVHEKNVLIGASFNYGDKNKALTLTQELESKINLIKAKTKVGEEILENLKKSFEEKKDKIYGIQRVGKEKIIANFSSLDKRGDLINLIKAGNDFLVINKRVSEVYEFDQKTNKVLTITKIDQDIKKIINYKSDELILSGDNRILTLNLKNRKISPLKIESSVKQPFIGDLKTYEDKLYLLDNKNNQIFKYLKTTDGFGKEVAWLKEKVNLKDSLAMVIDGSIYLLKPTTVVKLHLGKTVALNLEKIYPSLEKVEEIITDVDFKNIYLLEPNNKRIVIFDKRGKFIKQIVSDKFTDLKDLVVDEKENKIWLLNDTEIVEIKI